MTENNKPDQTRKTILILIFVIPPVVALIAFMVHMVCEGNGKTEEPGKSVTQPFDPSTPVLTSPLDHTIPREKIETLSKNIMNQRVWVSHILVSYRGAKEADDSIKISKEEAYNLALEIKEKVADKPETFASIAQKYSDDRKTGPNGGLIPPFNLKEVAPSFREAIIKLKPGEISSVVETEFGYHVMKREQVEEAILQSILIPYKGAFQAADSVAFSRTEAQKHAEMLHKKITASQADFGEMARKHSQDPWAANGGYLRGVVIKGKSIPHKEIEDAAFSLKEGGVSKVFHSKLGFHILKRHKVEARQACHITVYFDRKRGKDMAEKIIRRAYTAIQKKIPFPEVVETYSDEQRSKGFTPMIYRGTWVYLLEEKLFSMKPGEVSKPIELRNAYVIIARVR
jgi:parvulin-like peptidyl-prolyl isomerase